MMHPNQLAVPIDTVRTLVAEQFPAWAGLPVLAVESQGTVNALFRIGDRLAARFPIEPGDAAQTLRRLESEAAAALKLAGSTRFPTPEPVALGRPGYGYPPGVIDVGACGPADPALDLVGAWHLLEAGPREILRRDLGCDDREWERGRAWAFAQAMGLVWYYVTSNPRMSFVGRRTLDRLLQACDLG